MIYFALPSWVQWRIMLYHLSIYYNICFFHSGGKWNTQEHVHMCSIYASVFYELQQQDEEI
jgi:hypothetical protein